MTHVAFTDHAIDRYAQRFPDGRPMSELVPSGRVQTNAPGGILVGGHGGNDGWLVCGQAAFPLRRDPDGGALVATTCLRRRRLSKLERRAKRDAARDEDWRRAA